MLNMAIKGPLWRRAGGGMNLSPSFWKVSETKISDNVSHVTPLSELNEMVQYTTFSSLAPRSNTVEGTLSEPGLIYWMYYSDFAFVNRIREN